MIKIIISDREKIGWKTKVNNLRHFLDHCKRSNIGVIIWAEKVAENFPNLEKSIIRHIPEAEQTSNRMQSKKFTPRHIIFKLLKAKGRNKKILKGTRERNDPWSVEEHQIGDSRFLIRNHRSHNIFQVPQETNCQRGIIYPMKIFFSNEEKEIRTFSEDRKLTGFVTNLFTLK